MYNNRRDHKDIFIGMPNKSSSEGEGVDGGQKSLELTFSRTPGNRKKIESKNDCNTILQKEKKESHFFSTTQ